MKKTPKESVKIYEANTSPEIYLDDDRVVNEAAKMIANYNPLCRDMPIASRDVIETKGGYKKVTLSFYL